MYLPIGDYALIGDCHAAALVSRDGSIDWCCLPRFDSDSCFGRLLDHRHGGHFAIGPAGPCTSRRAYQGDSLVLVTTFQSDSGSVRLTDFFAMRQGGRSHPRRELIRIVEGLSGSMQLSIDFAPRFDYGEIKPWIYQLGDAAYCAVGSNAGLLLSGNLSLGRVSDHRLRAHIEIAAGHGLQFAMQFVPPEDLHATPAKIPTPDEPHRHLDETLAWWRQ